MRRIVFVDLDDTLFQTARKRPEARHLAAVDRDGNPLSYQCGRQTAFLDWLAGGAEVVPVTGRSVDAFRRVTLPLGRHAICSFGGVILEPDGTPHGPWHERTAAAAAACADDLAALHATLAATARAEGIDVRHRVIEDTGLPLYLSVKHNQGDDAATGCLAAAMTPAVPTGWTLHVNGSNMALLPPFLGKAAAVAYFLETMLGEDAGPRLTIGVGDSLTDLGFMRLCDFAVAPTGSQILAALTGAGEAVR